MTIESHVSAGRFEPAGIYFDTPTYGLAPIGTHEAVVEATTRWRRGVATMAEYDAAVGQSRELFSSIVAVQTSSVAIGPNVSSLVGPVAAGLASGSTVLAPEDEFTSLLFPLLVNRGLDVRTVTLDRLSDALDDSIDVLAFSLVQSSSGAVADAAQLAERSRELGVLTMVDATHAAGWFPFDAAIFDFCFVAAYKWLMCPRGVAFMTINSDANPAPLNAGWYAGEDPWSSIYGGPLRLASSARRYDTSPAWLSWMGAVPSLELVDSIGVQRIHNHDVQLANSLRLALGMPESPSAIVTIPMNDPGLLAEAEIKASIRVSNIRVGCHIHNTSQDVSALVDVISRDR